MSVRIANCSGFYGDRLAAMREMLDGGPVDVITGDYLAELTMLILGRQQVKNPAAGYARTFLRQLEDCLADLLDRGVKVVGNAGGLNPRGLAAAVQEVADRLGVPVRIATVDGDDLRARWPELRARGLLSSGDVPPANETKAVPPPADPLTANAYLGCWGVVRALERGADIVVTGRITDASLVVGPAAWYHGWGRDDLDALAGATVAGHVLECGAQATGGNFSLFADLLDADPGCLDHVGFPLAEIAASGDSVITKHAGTGGAVTVATVTEQLLYECTGLRYGGPDVVTRFDTVALRQDGRDRVRITGVRGEPPSPWLKVATNRLGGFRNTLVVPLTGLDPERKADLLQRQLAPALAKVASVTAVVARTGHRDADTEEAAGALLRITVKDPDRDRVGRAFTGPVVELGLASIPGFFTTTPPGEPSAYGVYAAAWVPAVVVPAVVTVLPDGPPERVGWVPPAAAPDLPPPPAPLVLPGAGPGAPPLPSQLLPPLAADLSGALPAFPAEGGPSDGTPAGPSDPGPPTEILPAQPAGPAEPEPPTGVRPPTAPGVPAQPAGPLPGHPSGPQPAVPAAGPPPAGAFAVPVQGGGGPTRRLPLGLLVGARSGDKGGAATLGVYTRTDAAYTWLADFLTPERLAVLLPEVAALPVTREALPQLRALLFQLPGLLGEGVAAATRFDAQAKGLGEWLRSRVVDLPLELLPGAGA